MANPPISTSAGSGARPVGSNVIPTRRCLPDDDDKQPFDEFCTRAVDVEAKSLIEEMKTGRSARIAANHVHKETLHVIDWKPTGPDHDGTELDRVVSMAGLERPPRESHVVRVIFAPEDIPVPETIHVLKGLFERYEVPSAFIAEGLQHVSQSFGVRKGRNGADYVWFHFLSKNIAVSSTTTTTTTTEDQGPERIIDSANNIDDTWQQSQANFTWVKSGFVLQISDPDNTASPSSQSRSTTPSSSGKQVNLLCFGAPESLYHRLKRLRDVTTVEDIHDDPYILLEIVLEQMGKLMDDVGWTVSRIFGAIETKTLGNASSNVGKSGKEVNFTVIFMPLGTVAAIFGTQLVRLQDEAPYHMTLSRDFWLIWAIAVPLTMVVVVVWRMWYGDSKALVMIERPKGPLAWRGLGLGLGFGVRRARGVEGTA